MTQFISDESNDVEHESKAFFGVIALFILGIIAIGLIVTKEDHMQRAPLECTRLDEYAMVEQSISIWDCGHNKRAYLRESRETKTETNSMRLILPIEGQGDAPP